MFRRVVAALFLALLVSACTTVSERVSTAADDSATLAGEVTYRERMRLPPEAVLTVHLVDVSRADAPAEVIATELVELDGDAPPYPFRLTYDPARIEAGHRYALEARIERQDTLLMRNTEHQPVLTGDDPAYVRIVVRQP